MPMVTGTDGPPPRVSKEVPASAPTARLLALGRRRRRCLPSGSGGGATAATLQFRGGAGGRTGGAGRGAQWPGLWGAPRRQ